MSVRICEAFLAMPIRKKPWGQGSDDRSGNRFSNRFCN